MFTLKDSIELPESIEQMRFKVAHILTDILQFNEVSQQDYRLASSVVSVFYDFINTLKGEK